MYAEITDEDLFESACPVVGRRPTGWYPSRCQNRCAQMIRQSERLPSRVTLRFTEDDGTDLGARMLGYAARSYIRLEDFTKAETYARHALSAQAIERRLGSLDHTWLCAIR